METWRFWLGSTLAQLMAFRTTPQIMWTVLKYSKCSKCPPSAFMYSIDVFLKRGDSFVDWICSHCFFSIICAKFAWPSDICIVRTAQITMPKAKGPNNLLRVQLQPLLYLLHHPAVYPSVRSCVSVAMINRRGSCGFCPSFVTAIYTRARRRWWRVSTVTRL